MSDTAGQMRNSFDASFAAPRETAGAAPVDLLGISVGGDPHVIRLSAITSVLADRAIAPLPGRAPSLLGIAGLRGAIMPVFDLGALLGYPPIARPRWLAVAERSNRTNRSTRSNRSNRSIALAFEAFLGHLRATPDAFAVRSAHHVAEVVGIDGRIWPVIEISSVLGALDGTGER